MKVKELIEELKNVDPELTVYVYSSLREEYREADTCLVTMLFRLDGGKRIYNEETDEYETFTALTIDD